ncbi:hypothetical protein [Candidatus Nitrosotenuis chungbukensis]|nr:hypothetical protein [Candidatus Nitrosotenuis chungbukensis]
MWTITVTVALSSLLILAYFVLYPITAKDGTVEQTKMGLDKAINRVETLRDESKQVPMSTDSGLNP